ncbi:GNAT family N-acetyltransferase [Mesorhizobium sp. WSM4307]|jgi:Acetyltransferases|uniref:GNAT family N-acetyltransferase n=1 Tax=unclassified Mesorhizobium TaxID=325217 RepID=UPI000BAF0346|nr:MULTISPECIES: GNAT family N-acetyltransferase [unclassified Mesorhizobium]PBB24460.1 GNAT family N-acetyltransferase [Mesorhizobium sp. WSM4304]PBB74572.1 GNAT family N-acetyltransferase [Mesorhizobium sp. WSM4308]TRC73263.1 GNAT family N-acetyltransferase [Mesorhizobium sp. WSM4315]TRC83542.1 GNAT family N-acetyltransferase [Mesorhizobium sp. WSM4307]
MSTGVSFRIAERVDSEEIMRALRLLAESIGIPGRLISTRDDIETAGFGTRREFTVMLAEVHGTIAGICLYFPMFSSWMGKPGLYIQDLFVHEEFRSARIGEKLLRHVAFSGRRDGYHFLRLTVDHSNLGGARFYLRQGFQPADDETSYRLYGSAFDKFCRSEN